MKGRKPNPTAIKQRNGNPGKRGLNKREPIAPADAPVCPEWLSDDAKAIWKHFVGVLAEMNLLSRADQTALAALCHMYARWQQANKDIQEHGLVLDGPQGPKKNPAVTVESDCVKQIKGLLVEFGLTPSARSRVQAPPPSPGDPLEEFLKRGGQTQAFPAPAADQLN